MAERYEPLTILKGKHAVVTGAASGIGFAIAEWFAAAGARVGVIGLELERAQEAVDKIARAANRDVSAFACDVADSSSVNRVFDRLALQRDAVDILVNSAGIAHITRAVRSR